MATTKTPPAVIIARAGAELLAQIAQRPTINQSAYANAVGKAMQQLIAGTPVRREGTALLFPSRSRAGQISHRTSQQGCTCEAAQDGQPCWHRAARQIILTMERQQTEEAAQQAQEAGARPPAPSRCRHCQQPMRATATPAGEPCYECSNPRCQWTVQAAAYAPPQSVRADRDAQKPTKNPC